MTIKASCKDEKQCGKCGKKIYRFETRDNRDNGSTVHLKGQCPDKGMDRPPGTDNPVVGVDSIKADNIKLLNFIGIMLLIIMVLLGVAELNDVLRIKT